MGRDICHRLAADGRTVAVASRDLPACQAVAEAINGTAFEADAVSHSSMAALASSVEDRLGRIDAAVSNAGRFSFLGALDAIEPDRSLRPSR
jgi:NAD(P)-dependent dehydrogenase (short-subunit alcohol dehydrogenase family)